MENVPPQVRIYLSSEYLKNHLNYETAIDNLLEYFECEQFPLPYESIQDIINILEDQSSLSPELIENILFLLDISLKSITSDMMLSNLDLITIRRYFFHPGGSAINIFSHAIRLNPVVSEFVLKLFPQNSFNQAVIKIFSDENSKILLPILQLVFYLSDKPEITNQLTDIFQMLIPKIHSFQFPEQVISFKILVNFCQNDTKYYSILYNNDCVDTLLTEKNKNIADDKKSLNEGFKFLYSISKDDRFEQPLNLIERLKIQSLVKFIIQNHCKKAITIFSNAFYEIILKEDKKAVDYFLENDFLSMFLSLNADISYYVWQNIMEMICIVVYAADEHQIKYIIENSNAVQLIVQISENIDVDLDPSQKDINEAMKYALKNLYEKAEFAFNKNKEIIFSKEIKEQLEESAAYEQDDEYQPITQFVKSINRLYRPILEEEED